MENDPQNKKLDVRVVFFDVIGTTIIESREGIINHCFEDAFSFYDIPATAEFIRDNRGKSKLEVIDEMTTKHRRPSTLRDEIYERFRRNVTNSLHEFIPAPGVSEIFEYLEEMKIKIALGSGLPSDLFQLIFQSIGWRENIFSYIGTADDVSTGRPSPEMIFSLMAMLSIKDPKVILKVGDTVSDIREGKHAGSFTAVVLSGTQPEETLRQENPDIVLNQLTDLKNLL